jgi:hypothetical protein
MAINRNAKKVPTTMVFISATIMPQSLNWPGMRAYLRDGVADIRPGKTYDLLRTTPEGLRDFAIAIDTQCCAIENDEDLTPEAIGRRRNEIGQQALRQLQEWAPLAAVEQLVTKDVAALDEKMPLPERPADHFDSVQVLELARLIKSKAPPATPGFPPPSPISWLLHNGLGVGGIPEQEGEPKIDLALVRAGLHADRRFTGLKESDKQLLLHHTRHLLHPELARERDDLTRMRADLREGVAATQRFVRDRCRVSWPIHQQSSDGEKNPWNPADWPDNKPNLTQQGVLLRTDRAKAERLAAAAGTPLHTE